MPTTVTQASNSGVTQHRIDLRGQAGVMFGLAAVSTVLNIVAFATNGWSMITSAGQKVQWGLWEICGCQTKTMDWSWFRATQAMVTIGMILSVVALISVLVYICVHTVSKNLTLLIFMVVTFASFAFMMIGIVVYGTRASQIGMTPSFSYAFAVIATVLCVIAGVLGVIQRRTSETATAK